ncbi:MAG: T9SS type A sorting domain-containing protein [Bacteroidota bacterium]
MKTRLTVLAFGRQCQRLALMLACVCLAFSLGAQRFEKSFGGPKDDFGQAILQTQDHGYLEVGTSRGVLGDDNDFDIFVVRTDVDGTTIWERLYDAGFTEQASEVTPTSDGGYMVIGYRQETPTSSEETLLLKLDARGNEVYTKFFGVEDLDERGQQIIPTTDDAFLLTGYRKRAGSENKQILVTKVTPTGEVIWRSLLGEYDDNSGIGAVCGENGGFIIGANVKADRNPSNSIAFYGISTTGEMAWSKLYGTADNNEQIEDIIRTSDGNIAYVGSLDNFNTAFIAKANLNGDTLWTKRFDRLGNDNELRGVIEEDEGATLVAVGQTTPSAADLDVLLVKVNSLDGQEEWVRKLGSALATDIGEDLAPTTDGGYALAAFSSNALTVLGNEMVLFKTDDFGTTQTNYLEGRVYHSTDNDCGPFADGDRGLEGWLVRAESDMATFFGSTDSLGNYTMRVDSGIYEVTLLQKNNRWNICAPGTYVADHTEAYDTTVQDFALTPDIACPLLEVSLSATPAVQCATQAITIDYGNSGTDLATGAYVTLMLDEALTFASASPAPTEADGQLLTFDLGDLPAGVTGTISLTATLACNDITVGQAISSRADIGPEVTCAPLDPDWDGSSVVVTSRCDLLEEEATFIITNVGDADMGQTANYVIVEDIVMRQRSTFRLDEGASEQVSVPLIDGEAATYRLIAEQTPGHPGNLFPTAVVEGCRTDNAADFTTGFVAQFPDNDGNLNLDILTQEVVALEEDAPLQLTAYPRGYQDSIIIPKTDIEYTVFFELPNNDSFERVVIRDTLPEQLDFNSLEMGAGSHPYDFVLYQGGILKITFDSIRIFSGGGTGEAGAVPRKGYVSYRLSQKPNLTSGTVIRNRAAVYFDYQTPARSEETRHVVGCGDILNPDSNCLPTSDRDLPRAQGVNITLSPNPVGARTTVRITGWAPRNTEFRFQLFDAGGRKLYRQRFVGDQMEFTRPNLAAGTYFYEVSGGGYLIGSGQIVLQ